MNERFWELVEQADEEGGDDPDIRDEVFARLIIQECCGIVLKNTNLHTYHRVKYEIKNHFGVE